MGTRWEPLICCKSGRGRAGPHPPWRICWISFNFPKRMRSGRLRRTPRNLSRAPSGDFGSPGPRESSSPIPTFPPPVRWTSRGMSPSAYSTARRTFWWEFPRAPGWRSGVPTPTWNSGQDLTCIARPGTGASRLGEDGPNGTSPRRERPGRGIPSVPGSAGIRGTDRSSGIPGADRDFSDGVRGQPMAVLQASGR
jgi:hypothetical protein